MPAPVLDLRSTDDPRDFIHRAVQCLAEGRLVALPTETVYLVAASALAARGVERWQAATEQPAAFRAVAVRSADEALDYAPGASPLAVRLMRRCWPGPVVLTLQDGHPDSLATRLPAAVRQTVASPQGVWLFAPAHSAVLDVLRLTAGPLLVSSIPGPAGDAVTAADVAAALGEQVALILDGGRCRYAQPPTVVRVRGSQYEIVRQGVVNAKTLQRLASMIVLFVCTGNTCRSPMAEALFRKLAAQRIGCRPEELPDRGLVVMSAGTSALQGSPASPEAIDVLATSGLDLRGHESQPLTEPLARQADLILALTRGHRQAILSEWPDLTERVRLLSRSGGDVADPIGGPREFYERCAAQIEQELTAWVDELPL